MTAEPEIYALMRAIWSPVVGTGTVVRAAKEAGRDSLKPIGQEQP
jgi:hypothetical protein